MCLCGISGRNGYWKQKAQNLGVILLGLKPAASLGLVTWGMHQAGILPVHHYDYPHMDEDTYFREISPISQEMIPYTNRLLLYIELLYTPLNTLLEKLQQRDCLLTALRAQTGMICEIYNWISQCSFPFWLKSNYSRGAIWLMGSNFEGLTSHLITFHFSLLLKQYMNTLNT